MQQQAVSFTQQAAANPLPASPRITCINLALKLENVSDPREPDISALRQAVKSFHSFTSPTSVPAKGHKNGILARPAEDVKRGPRV